MRAWVFGSPPITRCSCVFFGCFVICLISFELLFVILRFLLDIFRNIKIFVFYWEYFHCCCCLYCIHSFTLSTFSHRFLRITYIPLFQCNCFVVMLFPTEHWNYVTWHSCVSFKILKCFPNGVILDNIGWTISKRCCRSVQSDFNLMSYRNQYSGLYRLLDKCIDHTHANITAIKVKWH